MDNLEIKLIHRMDPLLCATLINALQAKLNKVEYYKRFFILPVYCSALCKVLGLGSDIQFKLITYLSVIETSRKQCDLTYPTAFYAVYYTLTDAGLPEETIPIFQEMLKYLLFGDLIVESFIPSKVLQAAEKLEAQIKRYVLEHKSYPKEPALPVKNELTTILNRYS